MRGIRLDLALAAASLLGYAASPAPAQPHHAAPGHKVVPLYEGGKLLDLVSGDPSKAGAPYVIRLHNYDGMIAPPHWHPEDEHIVVVKGRWFLGHGDRFDRSRMTALNVGDYAMVPKRMPHFGWADGEIIIQVHGIGPFETNFLSEWKQLSDPKAASMFKFKPDQTVLSPRGKAVVRRGYRSARERITQYLLEKPDGQKFFALEEQLQTAR